MFVNGSIVTIQSSNLIDLVLCWLWKYILVQFAGFYFDIFFSSGCKFHVTGDSSGLRHDGSHFPAISVNLGTHYQRN